MKKQLVTLIAMLLPLMASAEAVEIKGVYYNLDNESRTAEVTSGPMYWDSEGNGFAFYYKCDIVIPEVVEYEGTSYDVTSIGDSAFGSSGLNSIIIPHSITSIGEGAFWDCLLTSITIPSSVTHIGEHAIAYCGSLASIIVEDGNPVYDSRNGCNAIVKTSDDELMFGCKYTVIPSSVTRIGNNAFEGCGLTNITIPNGVTTIGESAFHRCDLTSITISSSVVRIEKNSFDSSMKSIVVEEGNPVYDSREGCNAIIKTAENELFLGCKKTIIPNSVTSIGDEAFYGCYDLTSITIPNSVTTIGNYAFGFCQNLTSIKIPSSVTSLGLCAFCGCQGLTSIEISDGLTEIGSTAFGGCLNLKSITIPNSVKTILPYAFENCWALTSVKIPSSVTHIEYGVFSGCRELASIVVDKNNPEYDSREGCNAIIYTSDNELIAGCKNTVIPNSVTAIEWFAFQSSQNLTSITIPRSVREIGDCAFYGCSRLKEVTSYITKPFSIDESAFEIDDLGKYPSTLYVPIGTKDKYRVTEGWNNFRNIVEIEMVVPIEDEMAVSTESLGSENLSDNIVGGVYYNMGTESYDSTDGSIVISQSTDMEEIDDATPGSNDVKRNFEGIILQVAPDQGTITVNAKTSGNAQLGVQVGYDTPTIATQSEQGDVVVNYDVAEETYVYIYSYSDSNEARKTRTSSDDVVKIYGITIKPGTVGIAEVKRDAAGQKRYYTLEGRLINGKPVTKGIYIVNGRKIMIR